MIGVFIGYSLVLILWIEYIWHLDQLPEYPSTGYWYFFDMFVGVFLSIKVRVSLVRV